MPVSNESLQKPNKPGLNIISIIICIVLILVAGLGIYIYFDTIYRRDRFPIVKNEVDSTKLSEASFKKITSKDSESSIYVPGYWTLIDDRLQAYGDILTGAQAYSSSIPNTLGKVNSKLCADFGNESFDKLKQNSIYSGAVYTESKIQKYGNLEGCLTSGTFTITNKSFTINIFHFFSRYRIYQAYVQYPDQQSTDKTNSNIILSSLEFND